MSRCATLVTVLALAPATALAEPVDDGYCDFVEGSASATAAPLLGPEVFGQFGYIEQPSFAVNPTDSDNLRAIALTGVDRISIGALTKDISATDLSMRLHFDR